MSDRCAKCHRKLTDAISMQRGFGPVCWVSVIGDNEVKKEQGKLFHEAELPFKNDVALKRDEHGNVVTNVPHSIIQHSPSGFEWGYGGSGPAELALNILAMFTDRQTADELHQTFKWDFIAKLPYDGGIIKGREIRKWLREHRKEAS